MPLLRIKYIVSDANREVQKQNMVDGRSTKKSFM